MTSMKPQNFGVAGKMIRIYVHSNDHKIYKYIHSDVHVITWKEQSSKNLTIGG